MRKPFILLADDDKTYCELMHSLVTRAGYRAIVALDKDTCIKYSDNEKPDILFLDMAFPTIKEGFDVLDYVHEAHPEISVIMISGEGHIPDAVRATKSGALDFLEKPVPPEQILAKIANLENLINLSEQNKSLAIKAIGMVGNSKPMLALYDSIVRAAQFDTPVLITGETGVGKELVARAIHRLSKYSGKNLVTVNCGAIPNDLVEAELFGYEQGAFTHAIKSRRGYFEIADGSSIFLNEIGEMPFSVQAKLLRILSEGEMQKIGGKAIMVKVRVICDTNINIKQYIDNKQFREDLFYRISTITIQVPPLRDRLDDIPDLANYFMNNFCTENDLVPKPISAQAMTWLMLQPWKGNIRELKSVIERGVIIAQNDHLTVTDLQPGAVSDKEASSDNDSLTLRKAIQDFEKTFISNALLEHEGSLTHTATAIGVDKSNLQKKIRFYNITTKDNN
jgi:DNA-binding NtrC family response regulator